MGNGLVLSSLKALCQEAELAENMKALKVRPKTQETPAGICWSFLKKVDYGFATTRIQSIPGIGIVMTCLPCGGEPFSKK